MTIFFDDLSEIIGGCQFVLIYLFVYELCPKLIGY